MQAVVRKFATLSGIQACFGVYGSPDLDKTAILQTLQVSDLSGDFTHCLLVVAATIEDLKTYLHHDFHLVDWMAAVKPYGKGIVVFDSKLSVDFTEGKILHVSLVSSSVEPNIARGVSALNELPGIAASFEPHLGADFLQAVDWPDKAGGFTHVFTLVADDVAALKTFLRVLFGSQCT